MDISNHWTPERPDVITDPKGMNDFVAGMEYRKVLSDLDQGKIFCFKGSFGTALSFYSWLKKHIGQKHDTDNYKSSRQIKQVLSGYSNQLWMRFVNHQPMLTGAPGNGWIAVLFPDIRDFYIRFTDFLGMNGAWQWHINGIQYPRLPEKVHPYYGVYFPTRTEHLILFDGWLAEQKPFEHALDMGTGCGVLTFYLLKNKTKQITVTDINVNCLISVKNDLLLWKEGGKVQFKHTSLFDGLNAGSFDLIVFNPPWIPQKADAWLDKAMYYNDGFFELFFNQAYDVMQPNTQLALLFSNFAQAANIAIDHPIEKELNSGRFRLEKLIKEPLLQPLSQRKDWLSTTRKKENNELWILKKLE